MNAMLLYLLHTYIYIYIQVQSTNEVSKLWIAVRVLKVMERLTERELEVLHMATEL